MTALTGLAPAKVNLFLHVGPVQADGYHPLASLVAFADVGDRLTVERADRLSLTVHGRFSSTLTDEPDNLVLRALRALGEAAGIGEPPLRMTLDKALPVAAGLGGGSSDAGAALRLARDLLGLAMDEKALADIAGSLGADGAMCLHARAAWAEGRGDELQFEPRLPPLPAVLINPGVPTPTGAVYRAYDETPAAAADHPAPPSAWTVPAVIDWLAESRNDLEAPAVRSQPTIDAALIAARDLPGVRLVRMSGSGATVFALFESEADASNAAAQLSNIQHDWWVSSTVLR